MGKKKGRQAKVLKPIIENSINAGEVFVRELQQESLYNTMTHTIYEISFGDDVNWYTPSDRDHCIVVARISQNGAVDVRFRGRQGMGRGDMVWLKEQIAEILVMFKMGAYQSGLVSGVVDDMGYYMHRSNFPSVGP